MYRTFAAAFALAVAVFVTPAQAEPARDAVRSTQTEKVISTFGKCVRTRWSADQDECAPPAPPKPVPVVEAPPAPPPQPEISTDQRTVYFDYKKTTLSPKGKEKLDTLAGLIRSSSQIKQAKVIGFADPIGNEDYNIKLSEKRAAVVNEYLSTRITVPTSVLTIKGLGESQPVVDCPEKMPRTKRIECLAKDRRVEVELVYEK